ncbi:galactose-1-phosphate uridylyltransferase [Chloroflexota bacterium]
MSELRQDATTKQWVIIAPERAKRPSQVPKKKSAVELANWDASCPFCPHNEAQTPHEVFRIPASSEKTAWEVRVVPNRFAALTPGGDVTRQENGPFSRKMSGFGIHEVIIETPSHNTPISLLPYKHIKKILTAYQERYNVIKKNRHIRFIHIFKNHGWAAGTSLVHPHSQLVATPIISPYYHQKFDAAHDYFTDMGRCLYCDLIQWNLDNARERVVADTREFLVIHPYASRVPYETWILPKRHYSSFGLFPRTHFTELAKVLKDILFCLYEMLDNPAFNLIIDSTNAKSEEDPYYHWHVRIVPRLSTIAGFELGSGIYISTTRPEETAKATKAAIQSLRKEEKISIEPGTWTGFPSFTPYQADGIKSPQLPK